MEKDRKYSPPTFFFQFSRQVQKVVYYCPIVLNLNVIISPLVVLYNLPVKSHILELCGCFKTRSSVSFIDIGLFKLFLVNMSANFMSLKDYLNMFISSIERTYSHKDFTIISYDLADSKMISLLLFLVMLTFTFVPFYLVQVARGLLI